MMPRLPLLATAALCLAAPAAFAAPKAACLLLVDASGDAVLADGGPNRAALDVLSADVATGRRNLVGVLRMASTTGDPTVLAGTTYTLAWSASGVGQSLTLRTYADGTRTGLFDANTATAGEMEVPVLVDNTSRTVTWTVGRRANPLLSKKGTRFGGLSVVTSPGLHARTSDPVGADLSFAQNGGGDSASSGKTYTDLAPSCVKGV